MQLLAFTLGSLAGSCYSHNTPDGATLASAFVTSTDEYKSIYVECNSPSQAIHFMMPVNYATKTVMLVPITERAALLTISLENHTWMRLDDNSIGYILGRDQDGANNVYVVAAPPLLPPLGETDGIKTRRLYTYDDMVPLLSKLTRPILSYPEYGTHAVDLIGKTSYREFIGPLDVCYVSERNIVPVDTPNPFDLSLLAQANDYWPILLHRLQNHEGLNTTLIQPSHALEFLTSDEMEKMAKRYALLSLAVGDRVRIGHEGLDRTDYPQGTIRCVDGNEMSVELYSTHENITVTKASVSQYFEPLDLVEVANGSRKGVRGMVLYSSGENVTVRDENENSTIVRLPSFQL